MPPRAQDKLDFNEKLIQSGKGGGTDALLKRLKTLHTKLEALDQDTVDLKTVHKVTKQLIDKVILHHKDRGVKAYAACCLADVLRVYAPDAPYNADQLRDIFQFFVVQLTTNLKLSPNTTRPLAPSKRGNDSQSQSTLTSNTRITEIPYYAQYVYLIENLANIKSVVLIVDVPGADDLITTYFESFAEAARSDMNKQLWTSIVTILSEVLQEAETVPVGVINFILSEYENHGSSPDTPSFQLIVDVCNRCAVKLQRPIYAHFSDIQLEHGRDPTPADTKILQESHDMILTIFRSAPNMLMLLIPLLEENLRAADATQLRQTTTHTLGTMFGERPRVGDGVVDLARSYPSTWQAWLGRRVDKALSVRLTWIEATREILINHPERKQLEPLLIERVQDSDERARAAICNVIGGLDYETALHHISDALLQEIGLRMSDKKSVVREAAVTALARLWGLAQSEIEANDPIAVEKFAWIPQEMLHALQRAQGAEAKTQISLAFKTHVLPLPTKVDDEQAWVDRFLLVATRLDELGLKALDKLTGIHGFAKGSSPYRAFINLCEQNNGGVIEDNEQVIKERLSYVIDAITRTNFGEHDKPRKDLEMFAAANEPRLYKLFDVLTDPQSDLRAIVKSRNELLRRIEQSHTGILATFTVVIDAAAWSVINQSSIPGLIKRLQRPEGVLPERTADVAAHYLALISKHCAPMYRSHTAELVIIINDKRNSRLVEVGLQALSAVCKWNPDSAPTQKSVVERARSLALTGTPRQAKFAARFIVFCKDAKAASDLLSEIADDLGRADDEALLPLLRSASEIAFSDPQVFIKRSEDIVSFVQDSLMPSRSPSADEVDDHWVDEDQLEPRDRAKVIGMRVLTHACLGRGRARVADAQEVAAPILSFFADVLARNGMISDETQEGGQARVHMRLRAALCLIKLAGLRAFDKAITPYFTEIAFMMQDPIFMVRHRMLQKLGDVLVGQRLLPRWNLLPILTAIDPESDNVMMARSIMGMVVRGASNLRTEDRIDRVEMPLARLLHLLALHPDLDWQDNDSLKDIARFIELFADCIAHRDNIPLLYTIANKLKTVSIAGEKIDQAKLMLLTHEPENDQLDVDSPTINLYKMSEMALIILRTRAQQHQWPVSVYPGKIKLPSDIFHNLPSPKIAQIVARRSFLPDDADWVKQLGRKAAPARRQPAEPRSPREREPRERKRKTRATNGPKAPRKKRRSSGRDLTEDEESEESESDEDEDDEDESLDEAATSSDDEMDGAEGEAVMGRGGRRSAKTKARKAVKRKRKVKRSPKKRADPDDSSELSSLSD